MLYCVFIWNLVVSFVQICSKSSQNAKIFISIQERLKLFSDVLLAFENICLFLCQETKHTQDAFPL